MSDYGKNPTHGDEPTKLENKNIILLNKTGNPNCNERRSFQFVKIVLMFLLPPLRQTIRRHLPIK